MKTQLSQITLAILITIPLITTAASAALNGRTEPPIDWTQTYGSPKIDYANCVQQTTDLGYIIVGAYNRNAFMPWLGDVYLIKTDTQGNEEWHQLYGIYQNENVGTSVRQTSDGGYIISGYTGYTYHIDGYVIKTTSNGSQVWTKSFGNFDYYDSLTDIQITTDNNYIVCGIAGSYGAGSGDAWLIKIDPDGNELWNHTYGGDALDSAENVVQTADGGYILVGTTESFGTGGDAWIVKTDANGTEQWHQTFGGTEVDWGTAIQQTTDGGYIITGSASSYGAGNGDVWLIKTDQDGNIQWNTTWGGGGYDVGNSVIQTSDAGYFITGTYTQPLSEITDFYIIKTNATGDTEWEQILDNNNQEDTGNDGIPTADGGYIVTGNTGSYQDETLDAWLIKYLGNNTPPYEPSNPNPADQATNQDLSLNLSWTGGDPDGGTVYYTVALGTTASPPIVAENITQTTYNTGLLAANTTYHWQITATDPYGGSTTGPLWTFTTRTSIALELRNIAGKIGIHALLKNNGSGEANNVVWKITVTGGLLHRIKVNISDSFKTMPAGLQAPISTGMFFGFGKISITITVTCTENPTPIEKTATGKIRVFWVTLDG